MYLWHDIILAIGENKGTTTYDTYHQECVGAFLVLKPEYSYIDKSSVTKVLTMDNKQDPAFLK